MDVRDQILGIGAFRIREVERFAHPMIGGALPLALYVEVAGRAMQKDFESILERQFLSQVEVRVDVLESPLLLVL